jgi:hypothetical protein
MSRNIPWFALIIVTAALAQACSQTELPPCRQACLVPAEQLDSLLVDRDQYSLYAAKEEDPVYQTEDLAQALRALEAQRKSRRQRSALGASALYLRCSARTPQSALRDILAQPSQDKLSLLGLGGQRGPEVSFAALGLWRGERLEDALAKGQVRRLEPDQSPEACQPGSKPCPVWLLRLEPEATCADLMQRLEQASAQKPLLGLEL